MEQHVRPILLTVERWTRQSGENDPMSLYIFGDNDEKKGKKGQAVIRELPNAMGIPTKRRPSLHATAFYSDINYEKQCEKIKAVVDQILIRICMYQRIILPEDGLGTGLADLPNKSPKTYKFLLEQLERIADVCVDLR